MKSIRLAIIALAMGVVTNCAVYSQPPEYGNPPGGPPNYGNDRGYDNRGYDDRGYDDRGYQTPRVDVGFFYDELSPYGDWVMTSEHGWAWFPRNVHPYWRPYTEGRWVITDYGWTWVSYEPFGWATYHYGRWAWDTRFGWLWVPGTIWGPAWVSWQHGGGYVGWAPLPPSVGFEIGIGIRLGGFNLSIGLRPDTYNFVSERSFLEPRLSGHLIPAARNVTIIHNTTNITNYTYVDNRVVNRGVEVRRIEQATGQRVQQRRVAETRSKARSEVAQDEVRIYRPERQKLDAVRVGPRANAGQRPEVRQQVQDDRRPAAQRREAQDFDAAPRAGQAPPADIKQIEKQERRQKQELEQYQAQEQRRLEKLQQQEIAKARAQAGRQEVERSHQAEREALKQEQREADQQLEARQKAQRQAAMAAKPPAGKQAADQQQKQKKDQPKKNDKGRGQSDQPVPPPSS